MGDVRFSVSNVPDEARHVAVREAVLRPLSPCKTPHKQVQALVDRGCERWRGFLDGLRGAGCPRVEADGDFQYARNCPPCGVVTPLKTRACRLTRVCPWCHAREYVLEPFRRFERALYGSTADRVCRLEGVELLEFRRVNACVRDDLAAALGWCRNTVEVRRSREARGVPNRGGFVLNRVEAHADRLVHVRAGVLVVDEGVEIPEDLGETEFRRAGPLKKSLVHALGRVAPYHPGWLADPPAAAAMLAAFAGVKMSAYYGLLRGSKPVS